MSEKQLSKYAAKKKRQADQAGRVRAASGTEARKVFPREMRLRCDRPTGLCIPSIRLSEPSTRPPRAFVSELRRRLLNGKGL